MKILITEEEQSIVDNVTEFLTNYGHQVVSSSALGVGDADDEEESYDVFLCSMSMSDSNLEDILNHARTRYALITVLLMAGLPRSENFIRALELGADACISKPLRLLELAGILDQIENYRNERGLIRARRSKGN